MNAYKTIEALLLQRTSGWWDELRILIPDLKNLEGNIQYPEYHAEGDVATHSKLAVESCPQDCDPNLLWIALLHDIGKPATTTVQDDGSITSHGHAKCGADLAENILKQLGMPPERRRRIVWVIRHHMFHHSWQLKSSLDLTNRQRSYLTDLRFPLLLEFLRIDSLASQGDTDRLQIYEFYKNLWRGLKENKIANKFIEPETYNRVERSIEKKNG